MSNNLIQKKLMNLCLATRFGVKRSYQHIPLPHKHWVAIVRCQYPYVFSNLRDLRRTNEGNRNLSLKDHFRPEFLNRLDEIILFNILSPEAIRDIVRMQVDIVAKRLADKQISLTLSDAAITALAKDGYNPQYGARPLKRLIQTKILTPIANLMVARGVLEGGAITVDYIAGKEGEEGQFDLDVRKGPSRDRSAAGRARAAARA
jgi:hypothetical protein